MAHTITNMQYGAGVDPPRAAGKRARRRGISLVELLVATVILGIGLVALMQLYMAALWSYQKGRYLSLATQRAQLEYERVQNLGFYAVENAPSPDTYAQTDYTWLPRVNGVSGVSFTVDTLPGGQGTVKWQHFPPNTAGNSNMLKVDIQVTWEGSENTGADVRIVTLLANK